MKSICCLLLMMTCFFSVKAQEAMRTNEPKEQSPDRVDKKFEKVHQQVKEELVIQQEDLVESFKEALLELSLSAKKLRRDYPEIERNLQSAVKTTGSEVMNLMKQLDKAVPELLKELDNQEKNSEQKK